MLKVNNRNTKHCPVSLLLTLNRFEMFLSSIFADFENGNSGWNTLLS